jgi:hypothetical protein
MILRLTCRPTQGILHITGDLGLVVNNPMSAPVMQLSNYMCLNEYGQCKTKQCMSSQVNSCNGCPAIAGVASWNTLPENLSRKISTGLPRARHTPPVAAAARHAATTTTLPPPVLRPGTGRSAFEGAQDDGGAPHQQRRVHFDTTRAGDGGAGPEEAAARGTDNTAAEVTRELTEDERWAEADMDGLAFPVGFRFPGDRRPY